MKKEIKFDELRDPFAKLPERQLTHDEVLRVVGDPKLIFSENGVRGGILHLMDVVRHLSGCSACRESALNRLH